MDFSSIEAIERAGFLGFKTFAELEKTDYESIPSFPGVYMVLRENHLSPTFLKTCLMYANPKLKEKPIVIDKLLLRWLEQAIVVYIGKAGGSKRKVTTLKKRKERTLKERIKEYMQTGSGKAINHRGGRAIWQLKDCCDLLVCWQTLNDVEPKAREDDLILLFRMEYGKRTFGNANGGGVSQG